ncbi:MAG: hypothetical protein KGL39_04395 [Patescibacteria group bacterium]|nr:hypothetical protein [Patescibacteria group bacterium]
MSWASDALQVTEDTMEMIKAATSGITTSTGIAGIILDPKVFSLVPVDTPFFNTVPRRGAPNGSRFAVWQTLLNINNQQPDIGTPFEYAGQLVKILNQYLSSQFVPMALGGTVSEDALATAEGIADALAVDTIQTMNQFLIGQDIHMLNAQNYALPSVTAVTPTLTPVGSGGSIGASTAVYVKCVPRSGVNYYRGGSALPSTEASTTTGSGSNNSVTGYIPAVKGAACYDWWVGASTGAEYYYTTTATNTVTITAIPTATQNVPNVSTLPNIYNAGNAGPASLPTADTSYQSYWQNGLTASILGDYASQPDQLGNGLTFTNLVTPGSGTSQGAYYQSLDGAQLTVQGAALEQIDVMNKSIYDNYRVSTSRMLMGSQVITDIANSLLDNPQAVTWLVPNDKAGRGELVAGGAVATYLNKTVNGKPITLELMPHLPPGKIVAVADSVPFPGSNITTTLEVETLVDFWRFDYGVSRNIGSANGGPRYDFELRSLQAFKNYAAPVMGILDNIGAGVA